MTTQATKRLCACGCGVTLNSYNQDDRTWACRELAERTTPPAPPVEERPRFDGRVNLLTGRERGSDRVEIEAMLVEHGRGVKWR